MPMGAGIAPYGNFPIYYLGVALVFNRRLGLPWAEQVEVSPHQRPPSSRGQAAHTLIRPNMSLDLNLPF